MESRHVSVSDGISRFLSLLAILVALGSAVLLYQNNQRLKTELATIMSSQDDPEAFKTFAAKWDKDLTDALTEFNARKNDSLKEFDAAREARNRIAQAGATVNSGLHREEVEQIVSKQIELATAEPELQLVRTVMRPTPDADHSPAMVMNVGRAEAIIRAARFRPQPDGQFVVTSPPEPQEGQVVIEFDPSHNQGSKKVGYHKFYERSYILSEQFVPPKKKVNVAIEIRANGKHLDWGIVGDLELEYQDGRTVVIPDARAIFVADKEETT